MSAMLTPPGLPGSSATLQTSRAVGVQHGDFTVVADDDLRTGVAARLLAVDVAHGVRAQQAVQPAGADGWRDGHGPLQHRRAQVVVVEAHLGRRVGRAVAVVGSDDVQPAVAVHVGQQRRHHVLAEEGRPQHRAVAVQHGQRLVGVGDDLRFGVGVYVADGRRAQDVEALERNVAPLQCAVGV